jgi:hypothetical protein
MNRTGLQNLTEIRLREAKTLIDAGQLSGAYYVDQPVTEAGALYVSSQYIDNGGT